LNKQFNFNSEGGNIFEINPTEKEADIKNNNNNSNNNNMIIPLD